MQRFKEDSQTDQIQKFPLTAVWTSRYTSVINCVASSTLIRWLGVHQWKIGWKLHLSGKAPYLKYWLTVNSAKHQKFCSRLNKVFCHLNLARLLRATILYTAISKISRRQIFSLRFSKWDTYVSLRTYLIEL